MKEFKVGENLKTLEKKLVIENFCSKFIFINNDFIHNSYKNFPIPSKYLNFFKNLNISLKGFSNYSTIYFYKAEFIKIDFEYLRLNNYKYNIKSNIRIFNDFFLSQYETILLKIFNLLNVKIEYKRIIIEKMNNIDKFFSNKMLEINVYKKINKKSPRYF